MKAVTSSGLGGIPCTTANKRRISVVRSASADASSLFSNNLARTKPSIPPPSARLTGWNDQWSVVTFNSFRASSAPGTAAPSSIQRCKTATCSAESRLPFGGIASLATAVLTRLNR